ncbi:MAG: hypothetical protein LC118_10610 [Dehalococcoidia bacterium]|nr:hypothetical protein [Dehalococcoidia bacterium]
MIDLEECCGTHLEAPAGEFFAVPLLTALDIKAGDLGTDEVGTCFSAMANLDLVKTSALTLQSGKQVVDPRVCNETRLNLEQATSSPANEADVTPLLSGTESKVVTVRPGVSRTGYRPDNRVIEAADAAKLFTYHCFFRCKLRLVADVLELATATLAEQRTWGLDAIG